MSSTSPTWFATAHMPRRINSFPSIVVSLCRQFAQEVRWKC